MHPGDFILTPSWTYHDHGNPGERSGRVDGRPRHPARQHVRLELRRAPPGHVQPVTRHEGDSRAASAPTCCRSTTRRSASRRPSSRIHTRAAARRSTGCIANGPSTRPRHQDAVRQPGDRRLPDADDGRVPAVPAEGFAGAAVSRHRRDDLLTSSKDAARAAIGDADDRRGSRTTSSSCPRGRRSPTRPAHDECCSAFQIGQCRRRWGSGGTGSRVRAHRRG